MILSSIQANIFCSPWWLDATAGEGNWGLCEIKQGNQVVASMPWVLRRHLGFRVLSQPPLTRTLGPWIADPPPGTKYATRLAREKSLMEALIDQLPAYHFFRQNFAPEITNWLPFYWRGFKQTTRYTYKLLNLSNIDILWSELEKNSRQSICKAERQGLIVERSSEIDALLAVNDLTFERQGKKPPYSHAYVRRLFSACEKNSSGAIFLARDKYGRVHAGNFIVWNQASVHGLISGSDPSFRNSGANSLLLWHLIQFSSGISKCFDFSGSMIENIERFFRGFGAIQVPYFSVSHVQSRRILSVMAMRSLAKVWI